MCVQGHSQINSKLDASTLGEEDDWCLEADRVAALAAECYNLWHEGPDVEHEFWHMCCSQQSFSISLFPVAGSGLPQVCFSRGEGKQMCPQRGVRRATRLGDPAESSCQPWFHMPQLC